MEYIHRCLSNPKKNYDFNFHPRCEKLQVINISFADDLMMFMHGDDISV